MIKRFDTCLEYKSGFTHSGVFHADEVFCTAMLKMIDPDFVIRRGFKAPQDEDILVYDLTGRPEFDHHYKPLETRENGVPYAAFGKIWRCFAADAFGKREAEKLDSTLVQEIDAVDNGVDGAKSNISRFIHEMNPIWNHYGEDNEEQFWKAVEYATIILRREIESARAVIEAEECVDKGIDGQLLILDRYCPWIAHVVNNYPDVMFSIFPSPRGGYSMQVVPVVVDTTTPRLDVPEEWKGYSKESGKDAPFNGMTFCHVSGFLSNFQTKEQAIAAAKYIMNRR